MLFNLSLARHTGSVYIKYVYNIIILHIIILLGSKHYKEKWKCNNKKY